jgi:hypothetical protein
MTRTDAAILLGTLLAIVGAVVLLKAGSLATHWQRIGPDAWGGTTDPAIVKTYQILSTAVLAFGLVVAVMGVYRSLAEGRLPR